MKKTACVLIILFTVISSGVNAGDGKPVVYPKKDHGIRGTNIGQFSDKFIFIQTTDNSVFACTLDEIGKMTWEQSSVKERFDPSRKVIPHRNPGMAVLWSAFLPGGGQFYNRQYVKGALFTAAFAGGLVAFLASGDSYYYAPVTGNGYGYWYDDGWSAGKYIGLAVMCAAYVASVVDAPLSSMRINRRNKVSFNMGPNRKLLVTLKPDVSLNEFGYSKPSPSFGARLSVSLR
jgi:TM2 domain-containing membrane protein YozV